MQNNYVPFYDDIPDFVYHGSYTVVWNPEIRIDKRRKKDFGHGFYCTRLYGQAKEWATRKTPSYVTAYAVDVTTLSKLNKQTFRCIDDDWLDFIISCRRGVPHKFDVVIGPMADDTIQAYIPEYLHKRITKKDLMELCKSEFPTHQMVFCTPKSLEAIRYFSSEGVYL